MFISLTNVLISPVTIKIDAPGFGAYGRRLIFNGLIHSLMFPPVSDLPRAFGDAPTNGRMRACNEDFYVEEQLPLEPSGEGEHIWLEVEKNGMNTDWLAKRLAEFAGVKPMAVSYAGMKDRNAVTRQWYSVQVPIKQELDFQELELEGFRLLRQQRHSRKLKRGTLSGNRFRIRLRDLEGDLAQLEPLCETIRQRGMPNYFGEQRFGHGMNNLERARALFEGQLRGVKKHQRGIYLSAARSWLFNRVLGQRVEDGSWDQALAGDVFMLDGRSACFADDGSADLPHRLAGMEIHPTGPMWGRGELMTLGPVRDLEQQLARDYPLFCEGLEKAGLNQERRALRVNVTEMHWQWEENQTFVIDFCLPAGSYATSVLRELGRFRAENA